MFAFANAFHCFLIDVGKHEYKAMTLSNYSTFCLATMFFTSFFLCELYTCIQGRREKMWGPGQNFFFWIYDIIFLNFYEAREA